MIKITLAKRWQKWGKWQVLDVFGKSDVPTKDSVDSIRADWLISKEMAQTGTHYKPAERSKAKKTETVKDDIREGHQDERTGSDRV